MSTQEIELGTKNFEVYISHLFSDKKIAEKLYSYLKIFSRDNLKVHLSNEIPGTRSWQYWIEDRISRSSILIFLYTSEQADWTSCLYEIGLFQIPKEPKDRHLICIKNPEIDALPLPIGNIQFYDSVIEDIENFFEDFFLKGLFTNSIRLNEKLFTEYRKELIIATEEISSAFGVYLIRQDIYERQICINLQNYQNVKDKVNFEEVSIQGDPMTMDLLDIRADEVKWTSLQKKLKPLGSASWLDDLKSCIDEIRFDKIPKGILTPFKTVDDRSFVPVLSSVEKIRYKTTEQTDLPQRLFVVLIPLSPADSLISKKILDESSMIVKPVFLPIKENINPKLVFVLMPFNEEWSGDVFNILKTTCNQMKLEVKRADDIFDPNIIVFDIWRMINKAGIIIADLTTHNSNVLYELGIAHAIGKKVILIRQDESIPLPFDVAAWRVIEYRTSAEGKKVLIKKLRKSLSTHNRDIL
jgi:hypothetical protein